MTETVTFTLTTPVQFGQKLITELTIREPTAKDLSAFPAQSVTWGDVMKVLARCSGQYDAVIDQLSIPDMMGAMAVLNRFLPGGPAIGETP